MTYASGVQYARREFALEDGPHALHDAASFALAFLASFGGVGFRFGRGQLMEDRLEALAVQLDPAHAELCAHARRHQLFGSFARASARVAHIEHETQHARFELRRLAQQLHALHAADRLARHRFVTAHHEQRLAAFARHPRADLLGRPLGDDLPLRDDHHARADRLDLARGCASQRKIVCSLAERLDQLAHLEDLVRVEPGRRLVEDQEIRRRRPVHPRARRAACSPWTARRSAVARRPSRPPAPSRVPTASRACCARRP